MTAIATPDEDILAELEAHAAAPPVSDSAAAEAALLNESISGQIDLDTVVPAGQYLVKIIEVTAKKSEVREERDPANPHLPPVRKGGNLYFNVKLQILTGEQTGRFVFDMVMLTGKGAARMALLASKLGFYDKDAKTLMGFGTPNPTMAQIKDRIFNQVVGIETEVEAAREYNGKKQPPRAKVIFQGYFTPEEIGAAGPSDAATAPSWG